MKRQEFAATLFIYDDGTLAVRDSTIRGLVLETTSFEEMRSELNRIVPQLLELNHNLKEGDTARVVIRIERSGEKIADEPVSDKHENLEFVWEDHPSIQPLVLA